MNRARQPLWRRLVRRGKVQVYALCLLWAALVAGALHWGASFGFWTLVRQELATVDLRFRLRGPELPAPEIVILVIDERSYVADTFRGETEILARSPELGLLEKFPFPRRVFASAIQRLCEAGAKVVALDVLFFQPTGDDGPLREAIEKYRDRVVIGSNFSEDGMRLREPDVVVPESVPMDSVAGYVNYWRDPDRFVRRARLQTYESAEAGVARFTNEPLRLSFDGLILKKFAVPLPLPNSGQDVYINFPGPPGSFPSYEFYQVFYDNAWRHNLKNGEVFRDKIVLIGPGGNFQQDTKPTPFGSPIEMPGVEIHAAALGTLLHGSALREAPVWLGVATIVLLALAAAVLLNAAAHPTIKILLLVGTCIVYFAIAQVAFVRQRLIVLTAAPLGTVAGSGFLGIAMQLLAEQLEKRRVRQTLDRYVSKPVADEILRHAEEYQSSLGGERRHVAILFSDIRGFTTTCEQSNPVELVQQLNEYFTEMVGIVMKHDGTLSKFIGDAVMALYGAPLGRGAAEDAWRAVQTAYEMRLRLAELQQRWAAQGRPQWKIGIGLNYGEVVVGDIGSVERKEYTVIGDPVNVASRVEGLNKEFGTDILLTETVYELVKAKVETELIGSTSVRGREQKINLYLLKALAAAPGQPTAVRAG